MTNGERIRGMSDKELAKMLVAHMVSKEHKDFNCRVCGTAHCTGDCEQQCLQWLKTEERK